MILKRFLRPFQTDKEEFMANQLVKSSYTHICIHAHTDAITNA